MSDKNSLRNTGVSAIWILANVSYAGMKAQNIKSRNGTRILALIFGLPGTLLTMFVVKEGSNRAYGVDLPSNPEVNNHKIIYLKLPKWRPYGILFSMWK